MFCFCRWEIRMKAFHWTEYHPPPTPPRKKKQQKGYIAGFCVQREEASQLRCNTIFRWLVTFKQVTPHSLQCVRVIWKRCALVCHSPTVTWNNWVVFKKQFSFLETSGLACFKLHCRKSLRKASTSCKEFSLKSCVNMWKFTVRLTNAEWRWLV